MDWEAQVKAAEDLVHSAVIPSSELIITSIKRVNPTRLCLPESDKERGYQIKNHLQNLLLENYGEAFHLVPHPCSPNVALIKHRFLPSVDACHSDLNALSPKALDTVGEAKAAAVSRSEKRKGTPKEHGDHALAGSPKDALRRAQQLFDQYEYVMAEQELAALRLEGSGDVVTLVKAVRMLFEEMGAYQTAIDTLQAQGGRVLQDRSVRELLALAYHGNGLLAEAGAVFDSLHPSDLGKDSLSAYARLALHDGNLLFASKLLRLAEEKNGFVAGLDDLKKELEQALSDKAEPVLMRAVAAFSEGDLEQARSLAHETLRLNRDHPKARRIMLLTDMKTRQDEVAAVWKELEACGGRKTRVQILEGLLELDRNNTDRISELLRSEMESERNELISQRLCTLRTALEYENWAQCFEVIMWLSRRKDAGQALREAASLSPLFQLLYQNKRLERLPQQEAKDVWLSFMKGRSLSREGHPLEALPILTKVRPYLRAFPQFCEEYEGALAVEQAAATDEAQRLLREALAPGGTYAEVNAISHAMRRVVTHIAMEERAAYLAALDRRLAELRPRRSEQALLEEYETALLMGDAARASTLAIEIGNAEAVAKVDAHVAQELRIEVEPVTITVSPTMQIDLEKEHPFLYFWWCTGRHACMKPDCDSVIIIDLHEMTAWRLKSVLFSQLVLHDNIAEKNLFLFRKGKDGAFFYRLALDGAQSRFTSVFELNADLWPGGHLQVYRLFFSSSKENEYYCVLKNSATDKGDRMIKFSLSNARNPSAVLSLKDENARDIQRTTWEPDSFLVVTEKGMRQCNKNLVWTHRFPFTGPVYEIDQQTGYAYYIDEMLLVLSDFKNGPLKSFMQAFSAILFSGRDVLGICPETETVLFSLKNQRGTFYNLSNNTFSSQVLMSKVICTQTPSRWYYFESDESHRSIRLRDITSDIGELLQWKELFTAGEPKEEYYPKLVKLREGEDLVSELSEAAARGLPQALTASASPSPA